MREMKALLRAIACVAGAALVGCGGPSGGGHATDGNAVVHAAPTHTPPNNPPPPPGKEEPWRAISSAGAPPGACDPSSVWSGKELLVWCAEMQRGFGYAPETDTWRPLATSGSPSPRRRPTVVWTGKEMFVWSGLGLSFGTPSIADGALFDPAENRWRPVNVTGSPGGVIEPAAAWTGDAVVLWGGRPEEQFGGKLSDTGLRYHPDKDRWDALPGSGGPSARSGAFTAWLGGKMPIFRGLDKNGVVTSHAVYDAARARWESLTAPDDIAKGDITCADEPFGGKMICAYRVPRACPRGACPEVGLATLDAAKRSWETLELGETFQHGEYDPPAMPRIVVVDDHRVILVWGSYKHEYPVRPFLLDLAKKTVARLAEPPPRQGWIGAKARLLPGEELLLWGGDLVTMEVHSCPPGAPCLPPTPSLQKGRAGVLSGYKVSLAAAQVYGTAAIGVRQ